MELILVRHAIAVERGTGKFPNDDRPLTPDGIRKMRQAAKSFPALIPRLDAIYTSPLSRARETASIIARVYGPQQRFAVIDELLPGCGTERLFDFLNVQKGKNRILLVGHEPDLSTVASVLMGATGRSVELKKGSACLLDIAGSVRSGSATVRWLLQPKHLRSFRW